MPTLTVSDQATIYGCCGLFDLCSDRDLMSLSFEGQNRFLDWIGWELTDVCIIKKNFITYARGARYNGELTAGYVSDPCGDSNGSEWGTCDFTLEDFGRLRRHGPVRDVTKNHLRLCDIQPRYRLDGSPIRDDQEFDMRIATEAMLQDLKRLVITGNKTTAGQFDGLNRLIKTNYQSSSGAYCRIMDSIIVDWNENGLDGGNGVTWNGKAVSNSYGFIDVLMAVYRRIRDRIQLAPALDAQPMNVGDMILVGPTHMLRCILDQFTCWSVCPGAENIQVAIQSYEARRFRDSLNGGMFGGGRIYIDGFEIPLMPYNWGLTDDVSGASDVYLLTGSVGNVKTISGQLNDMSKVPPAYVDANYRYTDGGRLLTWPVQDHTCLQREIEMQPRILMWAPWAQARFVDVFCDAIGGVLSPDPWESSFFPETSFCTASCP